MLVVFGSINMDLHLETGHPPSEGETVVAPRYEMRPGGKGANQALAAARAGAKTALIGVTGTDSMGQAILSHLKSNEVMTSGVAKSDTLPTGLAVVMKSGAACNRIIVASGANAAISASQVPDEVLGASGMVVLQMESPAVENINVMERAKKNGAKVILNLAPAIMIPRKELMLVDYLVVNEMEAAQIARIQKINTEENAIRIAQALAKEGDLTCVVTLGSKGSVAVTKEGKGWSVAALPNQTIVDTAGAGDCYTGTLAAGLFGGMPFPLAMKRASIAASLSCTKAGTQESFPYSGDVEDQLRNLEEPKPVKL